MLSQRSSTKVGVRVAFCACRKPSKSEPLQVALLQFFGTGALSTATFLAVFWNLGIADAVHGNYVIMISVA